MEAIAQKLTRKEKIAQGIAKLPGSKKKRAADARKERNKTIAFATLRNYPTSPRKMRLMADVVRNTGVAYALGVLKLEQRAAAAPMRKLLMSAIANWREKFADQAHLEECLYIKEIKVDGASMLKRFQPAPQGRAHRIRKRSNHITIVLDVHNQENA
ncbi:MAG: 50S ribosomal protein L22 [Bacteroidetes bacterium]|jgi:large subunit ribosomal protein L22|nr:50S ribosomal protein L22 [Bacteroidota bacterium]